MISFANLPSLFVLYNLINREKMLSSLLRATAVVTSAAFSDNDYAAEEQVLSRCPYHDQIRALESAWDTFVEQQGLLDMQEYTVRHRIASH